MLGPAPSASGEPSTWYADVAAPQRKSFGKEVSLFMSAGNMTGRAARGKRRVLVSSSYAPVRPPAVRASCTEIPRRDREVDDHTRDVRQRCDQRRARSRRVQAETYQQERQQHAHQAADDDDYEHRRSNDQRDLRRADDSDQ